MNTSIILALVAFFFYHIFQQLRHSKLWKKMPKLNQRFKKLYTKEAIDNLALMISFVNLGLNSYFHLPTALSEFYTHLFIFANMCVINQQ